jgi:Arc/MetJ-type ribon-helix-helix transcriptional regulator
MSDTSKISFRLSADLQARLAARVGQGTRVSDIIREALEAYLGMRPTARPTNSLLSDSVSDLSTRLEAVVSDLSDIHNRLERLEAREGQPTRVRQRQTARPTPAPAPRGPTAPGQDTLTPEPPPAADTPQARTTGGQHKLTPRQVRALRDKHQRGVPVPALMEEYGISRASVFRYLQSDKR